jgi:hypothetical protein
MACPDSEFLAELTAHPLFFLASRISLQQTQRRGRLARQTSAALKNRLPYSRQRHSP